MSLSKPFSRSFFSLLAVLTLALTLAGLLAACGDFTATPLANPTAPASTTTAASNQPSQTSASATTALAATAGPPATVAPTTTAAPAQATPGQSKLATATAVITKANGERLNMSVELARTGQEQETGLMGRLSVPDETGMLFVFGSSGRVAFWMKDTPLALSIAFITQAGRIIDIQDMESYSLDTHAPGQDYMYALEVAKGYFAKRGVKPGDTFTFQG